MAAKTDKKEKKVMFQRDYTYSVKKVPFSVKAGDSANLPEVIANKLISKKICKDPVETKK